MTSIIRETDFQASNHLFITQINNNWNKWLHYGLKNRLITLKETQRLSVISEQYKKSVTHKKEPTPKRLLEREIEELQGDPYNLGADTIANNHDDGGVEEWDLEKSWDDDEITKYQNRLSNLFKYGKVTKKGEGDDGVEKWDIEMSVARQITTKEQKKLRKKLCLKV